ncbi:MAG: aminoacyl-tRNA hydrolase [Comamonadaceae bacterium]|jgi:ribosome-associated protein|nr:aminoacyl-tRNA hydrolase [Comamonadaceae bacterium]
MVVPCLYPIDEREVVCAAIRAQGAGGQNVNKVSSAIHLRFDILASTLPDAVKQRLLASGDGRISQDGVLVLKAQQHRTQELNRADAMSRLQTIVDAVSRPPKTRQATRPTRASKLRRLQDKSERAQVKIQRSRVDD